MGRTGAERVADHRSRQRERLAALESRVRELEAENAAMRAGLEARGTAETVLETAADVIGERLERVIRSAFAEARSGSW